MHFILRCLLLFFLLLSLFFTVPEIPPKIFRKIPDESLVVRISIIFLAIYLPSKVIRRYVCWILTLNSLAHNKKYSTGEWMEGKRSLWGVEVESCCWLTGDLEVWRRWFINCSFKGVTFCGASLEREEEWKKGEFN